MRFDSQLAAELRRNWGDSAVVIKPLDRVAPRERRRWEERATA